MLVYEGPCVLGSEGGSPGVGDRQLPPHAAPAAQRLAETIPEVLRHEPVHYRVHAAVTPTTTTAHLYS